MTNVHPTAIVDRAASLAADVEIGPYCIIGAGVTIGSGTVVGPHTRIEGPTTIGERNRMSGQSSFGTEPQDLKYQGERTELVIGNENFFREFVTVNRGTVTGRSKTEIGSSSLFMAYSHVAHDSRIGSNVVFANAATLAGHVDIGDFATIGAFSAVHQFCRVGDHAFLGGFTVATQDALPFVKTVGNRPAKTYGINTIGLQRKGFPPETIEALKKAYRILKQSHLKLEEAVARIEAELSSLYPEVRYLVEFIRGTSSRGFIH
jgi:UDP-N-acetylglucosamine acyltransferase